jgi:hypothetical protein
MRKEHAFNISENKVLKKIFSLKRDEVVNGRPHDLDSSPSNVRIMKSTSLGWAGHVAQMGETRNATRKNFGGGNLLEKQPLGRPRRRSENSIKKDLWETDNEDRLPN